MKRGDRFTAESGERLVVTSVRSGHYGPAILATTVELWDTYGVRRVTRWLSPAETKRQMEARP